MRYCDPTLYSYFKDFAGPVATIIAAAVAVGVTAVFQWRQSRIAQKQTDIAFDQLRRNVFDKGYEIYTAAREAIVIALDKRDQDTMPHELNALFLRFEEARFFFPEHIHLFLDQLRKDIKTFLTKNYLHRKNAAQHPNPQGADIRGMLLAEEAALLTMQEQLYVTSQTLAKTFANVLAFPQLTGTRPG